MNGKQKFRCDICDKILSNYWAFEAHRATVHGKRTFICDVCNKAFKRKDHLANHKRSIHVVRTKYCLLCDLRFNRKIELVAHIKTVHPDEYISEKEFLPGLYTFTRRNWCRLTFMTDNKCDRSKQVFPHYETVKVSLHLNLNPKV